MPMKSDTLNKIRVQTFRHGNKNHKNYHQHCWLLRRPTWFTATRNMITMFPGLSCHQAIDSLLSKYWGGKPLGVLGTCWHQVRQRVTHTSETVHNCSSSHSQCNKQQDAALQTLQALALKWTLWTQRCFVGGGLSMGPSFLSDIMHMVCPSTLTRSPRNLTSFTRPFSRQEVHAGWARDYLSL